jgi:hypothetical protein
MEIQDTDELHVSGQPTDHGGGHPAAADTGPTTRDRTVVRGKPWWRLSSAWRKAAVMIAAAVVVVGGISLARARSAHAGPTTAVAPAAGTITVVEADLLDPGRLKSALARSGIPADIRVVHARVINGVTVAGCFGPNQEGLPQINDVLGQGPVLHKVGDTQGIMIKKSAMPRGTVLSFDFWVLPHNTRPTGLPIMSLHQGISPCTPPTEIPKPLPKSAGTPHQVP